MTLKKTILCFALIAALALSLAACGTKPADTGAESADAVYENGGKTLTIPAKYAELLLVETPQDEGGRLFRVSEKASMEAAKAQGYDPAGAGWLFGISTVDEATAEDYQCGDMSGSEIFARDESGTYYLYEHPTDVTLVREDNDAMTAAMPEWSAMNEWAWDDVRNEFVAANALIADERTNTDLDIHLAQIDYQGVENYTISTTEYGPMAPNGVDPTPFVEQLRDGVTIAYADGEEAPDGEYVVLAFPDDNVRFDFFTADKTLVREVWSDDYEALYRITFTDEDLNATDVMQAWYDALVESGANVALGYTADDLIGTWAEKIAGRGMIEIEKRGDGKYDVNIHWGSSAWESSDWTMTATAGNGGELTYDDCTMTTTTFTDETHSTTAVDYENGTGKFILNSANEIMWQDDVGGAGDDTVFISAK
ncbi:MAG: hypothetical protein IJT18_03285 [Oscillospiraceae bacterium]|nr:hypothetical protein [Oscillospiraceae bacterium]